MYIDRLLILTLLLTKWISFTHGLMGSPPVNLPECLHTGTWTTEMERYRCNCPDTDMNKQCKLLQVNVAGSSIEVEKSSFMINLTMKFTVHIGFEFITSDYSGNGTLLTIKNMNSSYYVKEKLIQLKVFLVLGRLRATFTYLTTSWTVQFNPPALVLNDNAWHSVDIFLQSMGDESLNLIVLVDRCKITSSDLCSINRLLTINSKQIQFGGYIQLGEDFSSTVEKFRSCFDNVLINRELIDFYSAIITQGSRRGCPESQKGCIRSGVKLCGNYGTCRNAIISTDMSTCQCKVGYRPETSNTVKPYQWACEKSSIGWSTTGIVYQALFTDKIPTRIRLSIRTRQQNFIAFAVAAWKLSLTVISSAPQLQFDNIYIQLNQINVSDGNWHTYEITFTPRFLDLRIDELDGIFYDSRIFDRKEIVAGSTDVVIAKGAQGACMDDAWVNFRDIWPEFEQDYPLEVVNNPQFTRYVQWNIEGRTENCSSGPSLCALKNQCDKSSTCVDEWRGFRCDCLKGMIRIPNGTCVVQQCYPNPCLHGDCHGTVETTNFTCSCAPNWEGILCNQLISINVAGIQWWWILIIVLLILLIIIIVIIIVVCCCRHRRKKKRQLMNINSCLNDENLGVDSHMDDPWSVGEKDFQGPIDYSILQDPQWMQKYNMKPEIESESNGTVNIKRPLRKHDTDIYAQNPYSITRDHGQKTTDEPPWEHFDRQYNPALRLDQVLEYGYEGYDGKPPPEFCPNEPFSATEN